MDLSLIIPHIEALIFASDKPLPKNDLVDLVNNALGFIEDRATAEQVEAAVKAISEKYESEFYSFEVVESGGGFQFLTKKEFHKTIAQLNGDKFLKKLSSASLETLSIIAYKQPVAKSEIEIIRGVNCDYAVQKLLEKDLIVIAGRNENSPGKPLIYATSKSFMDYFGINTPEDLPKIKEVLSLEIIEATKIEAIQNNEPLEVEIEATEEQSIVVEKESDEPADTTESVSE
ncbi:MAG: SMC-Scp complex subunit ScpB [Bacteroidota bacterium]|nr:SMC-Scp complex subunit ScpB [Bacteroidota bacterium]